MGSNIQAGICEVDLVVIGGGPTGLLTALLAHRLGVSVCVIDAKSGPLELGRADALNARTQQYLEVVKILDELLPLGIKCNTSSTFADGEFKSRQSHWWTSLEHTLHPNFLMIGQPIIEDIICRKLDNSVCYGESVVAISETEEDIIATTDRGRVVRSKYAVVADGARSTVRKALNISFKGAKPEMVWAVLDTFIDTDFPECSEIITFQLNGQSRVSWIPRERNMARFYVLLDGEITQKRAEDSIREHMAPHRIEFKKTEWFSTFEVKERIASTFVSKDGLGRIILAGDAAHVHSVNGGQGLNTGIADAFALAWRISMVVNASSHGKINVTDLIGTYDKERRSVAQEVINVAASLVRDTVHTAKQYVSTIERNAGYITGMGVAYDGLGSSLIWESETGIWKAGQRCPDICLTRPGETVTRRLYSLVSYGKFLVLMVGRSQDWDKSYADIATCIAIEPPGSAPESRPSGEEMQKMTRLISESVATVGGQFQVVIRPDMYIGFVSEGKGWKGYLDSLFVPLH